LTTTNEGKGEADTKKGVGGWGGKTLEQQRAIKGSDPTGKDQKEGKKKPAP